MEAKVIEAGNGTSRELVLPSSALSALRDSVHREAGSLAATQALHAAGHRSGEALIGAVESRVPGSPAELEEEAFWQGLRELLLRRGWGSLEHRRIHPGLGLLSSPDWAEADSPGRSGDTGCAFTSGLLSGLLGRVAGGPVAVLEVACRTRGDRECRFAFGSEQAIHNLYGLLLDGIELDSALQSL